MIQVQVPLRVSLLGGGSDYPAFADESGGLVVGASIDQYVYVSARLLPPYHDYRSRIVYRTIETVQNNGDVQHPVVRAVLATLGIEYGVEITYQADLPGRSGMGSSSAFLVGLLQALSTLDGRSLLPADLYRLAVHVEQNVLGEAVGYQDSAWACFGGLSAIHFLPKRDGGRGGEASVERLVPPSRHLSLDEDAPALPVLSDHVLLVFLGARKGNASSIASEYSQPSGENAAKVKSAGWKFLALAQEGKKALVSGDYEALGGLLDQAWREKRLLSPNVSTPDIDRLYDACRLAGAWGGKLLGAGGGGMFLVFFPPNRRQQVCDAVTEHARGATFVPYRVSLCGARIIHA